MNKLVFVLGIFILMLAVQIKFAPVAQAGAPTPELPQAGALVCEYKSSNASYRVAVLDLGEEVEDFCPPLEPCDKNESCALCLSFLSNMGYELELSNKVSGNRVVYTLANDYNILCPD